MAVKTQVELLQNRRTKIIATVGPASSSEKVLEPLILAGVNIFRLNMSHGDQAGHRLVHDAISRVSDRLGLPTAILVDLCGPKIRTGRFPGGKLTLTEGETVTISTRALEGGDGLIATTYDALARDVEPGNVILLADGVFELKVLGKTDHQIECEIVHGGELGDSKGINLPGVHVSAPSLTEKDLSDARFALELGVDFIALSFVRTASDIERLRTEIDRAGKQTRIVAKIEKPEALVNAESILRVTDAIMIARGDLGVELPPEQVPTAQRQLIALAQESGIPVIVATQMLESMIHNSRPTRAEVTDVFHAVESRADAMMLSAETAVGDYPVEAVKMMDRIARQTEAQLWSRGEYGLSVRQTDPPLPLWSVIATTTSRMSRDLMARAVIVVTRSGKSAEIVATARPASPIVALTNDPEVCRILCLRWGVIPILEADVGTSNPNALARKVAIELSLAVSGEYVLLVRGFHGDQDKNLPSVTALMV